MQVKLFTIPIENIVDFNDELNSFLNNNKVVEFEKQLVQTASGTYWCFYINYIGKYKVKNRYEKSSKIDYKNILSEAEFKTFDMLRLVRRQISKEDNVSAFVIATDAELADVAKLSKIDIKSLQSIKGFGEGKIEKYGKKIVESIENLQKDESK